MARRNRRGTIVTALAALGIILVGGREAKADLLGVSKGGIVQVGGSGTGTDPAYTYQFDVNLTGTLNGFSLFSTPTSITFDNLVGVFPLDLTGKAPTGWIYSINVIDVPTLKAPYFTSDVTWTYIGLQSIKAPSTIDLGVFSITTESNLPGGYAPGVVPTTVTYSYSSDGGGSKGGGSVSLQQGGIGVGILSVVPEPSTAIAPMMVLLGLPLVMLLKRRALRGSQRAA